MTNFVFAQLQTVGTFGMSNTSFGKRAAFTRAAYRAGTGISAQGC